MSSLSRTSVFEQLLTIVRRRWILMILVATVVMAVGYRFRSRQEPVYQAATKLKIIRGGHRSAGSDLGFGFEEDQVFYNTQYNLLRTQLSWAEQALDRAAWLLVSRLGVEWSGGDADPGSAGAAVAAALGEKFDAAELDLVGGPIRREDIRILRELTDAPTGPVKEDGDGGRNEADPSVEDGLPPGVRLTGDLRERLREALDSVRRDYIAVAWGIGPDGFLASSSASPIPGTYLAELRFTSGDPAVAVFMANLYAELYRDVSREARRETLQEEIALLRDQRQAAEKEWEAARAELDGFRARYPDLYLGETTNMPRGQAGELANRIDSLETDLMHRDREERHLLEVLAAESVLVAEKPGGEFEVRSAEGESADDFALRLAEARDILDLEVLRRSDNVALLRSRVRGLEEERYRFPTDLTDENPAVKRWRLLLDRARIELGSEVAKAVGRYLEDGARIEATIEDLQVRLEEKQREARELDDIYTERDILLERERALLREKESLDRGYEAIRALVSEDDEISSRLPIQNIEIERRARLRDTRQVQPSKGAVLAIVLVAAVLLSVGAAWVRDFLDDTIRTPADHARFLPIPHVGNIPRISGREPRERDAAMLHRPRSSVAEAFRAVRTGIIFSRRDEELRTLAITSAHPGEGKTTVAVNLAITMALANRGRVLLIDADLRKARVHRVLEVANSVGLTNCLVGSAALEDAVQPTGTGNLFVLPSGPLPPNPAELLGGRRMGEILEQARGEYDKVILDTPPVLAVTDPSLLATQVDGTFLVVAVGRTSGRGAHRAVELLKSIGVVPTGSILVQMKGGAGSYGIDYRYEYGQQEDGGETPQATS